MADIFISYKKEDAGRVIRMVEALRADGFDVWWDHGIKAGSEWDRSIHQELYAARVVIAIWSNASVAAPWVKEEATVGKNRGVLVPARIDDVDPPLGFMMIQAADLVDWDGDRSDPRWAFFLEAVRHTMHGGAVRGASAAPADAPVRKKARRNPMLLPIAGGAALVAILAIGAWMFLARGPTPAPSSAGAPAPQSQPAQQITEGEQRLWDRALQEKSRQAFQTYLVSYPNGGYANRARDALLTCRTETKEVWKAGPGRRQPDGARRLRRGALVGHHGGTALRQGQG